MSEFATGRLPAEPTVLAPDGAEVRVLPGLRGGSMAHFRLAPGQVTRAVAHRTVEEIWYVVGGRGQLWRRQQGREQIVDLTPDVCVTIPLGTDFQFRAADDAALAVIAVTMPPWPGEGEAAFVTDPPWVPTA